MSSTQFPVFGIIKFELREKKLKSYFTGVYVPLTTNGKIMVDGILTSCYADFDHDLAHLTITPIQKFAEVMEWIFGNDLGFSVYVGSARQLGQLMLPEGQYLSY